MKTYTFLYVRYGCEGSNGKHFCGIEKEPTANALPQDKSRFQIAPQAKIRGSQMRQISVERKVLVKPTLYPENSMIGPAVCSAHYAPFCTTIDHFSCNFFSRTLNAKKCQPWTKSYRNGNTSYIWEKEDFCHANF